MKGFLWCLILCNNRINYETTIRWTISKSMLSLKSRIRYCIFIRCTQLYMLNFHYHVHVQLKDFILTQPVKQIIRILTYHEKI